MSKRKHKPYNCWCNPEVRTQEYYKDGKTCSEEVITHREIKMSKGNTEEEENG